MSHPPQTKAFDPLEPIIGELQDYFILVSIENLAA